MKIFLFLALATASFAAPLRIAIPAAGEVSNLKEDQKLSACLALYLQERLAEMPGVDLVDENWSWSITHELAGGKRVWRDDDFLKSFSEYLPVDALVSWRFVGNELEVSLHRPAGIAQRKFPSAPAKTTVLAVARWLATELKLDSKTLLEDRIADPGLFVACTIIPRIVMDWPMNSGEKRLTVLHPFFPQNTNTLLAARVLESAYELFRSQSREQGYAKTALALAKQALPRVLGTPYELSAFSLLTNKPAQFEADLLALADDTPHTTGDLLEAGPTVTKAQRLGALRCLGICKSQKGLALIQQASKDTDPATREAAATALQYHEGKPAPPPPAVAGRINAVQAAPVIAALGKLTAADVERAKVLANNPFTPVAQAARLALANFRPPAGRERARFDLAIEHSYIRQRILDANANDAALLEEACRSSDSHTQTHALKLLFKLAPDRAKPLAQEALNGPYRWTRLHAAALLGVKEEAGEPVHSLGHRNLSWLCSNGTDCENSPFDAYYNMKVGVTPEMQRAYKKGKIFFARVTPVSNPGSIITDPRFQDAFWMRLEQELTPENLACLDGVILGEETMSSDPKGLWPTGWPLFCHDAGIDPTTINGDREKLSAEQEKAWQRWALTKFVEGFNILYDYIKLRYGRQRPGFMVGTFMPGQGTVTPVDKDWKFDLGGIYDYKGCNRIAAYALVRRYKTMWPDRPVLWLSLGLGGYEMNPVKFTQKVPEQPFLSRTDRTYADSVTAWLAGADTGWFSIWLFVPRKQTGPLAGVQVGVEDIGSPLLDRAINFTFRGAEKAYEQRAEKKPDLDAIDDVPALEEKPSHAGQVKQDSERMRRGFLFYGKYVYDTARVFTGLPRLAPKPTTLVIHPGLTVWSSSADFNLPAENVLNEFDYLPDAEQADSLDLSRYRVIVLSRSAVTPTLEKWRQQPGHVLLIDNATDGQTGTVRQVIGRTDQITGAASSWGASDKKEYAGVDLLTGELNPSVGGGRSGALVTTEYAGKYVACYNGVAVLCEQPIQSVAKIAGGLRVQSAGLMRTTGKVALPEQTADWILTGTDDGMVTLTGRTYFRSRQPVVIMKSP